MLYPNNFEDKIDFKLIRTRLKDLCGSDLGAELVDQVYFMTDLKLLNRVLSLTNEFTNIVREDGLPIGAISDLRHRLKQLSLEGTFWEASEYQGLYHSLVSLERIVTYFDHKEDDEYPTSKRFLENAPSTTHITQPINAVLDKTGEIKDNATPELLQIRQSLKRMQRSIARTMESVIKKEKASGLIDTDATPTLREGRLVIPVSSDNKRKLSGIIHDTSSTGKTAFIEPTAVVEANNALRELEQQERREIVKILISLGDNIRPYLGDVEVAYRFLGMIDFTNAKAKLANAMKAIKPDVSDAPMVEWRKAVHPLLYFQFKKEDRKVVPLDIHFDNEKHIVLISGPNAGGKSVCLKTVGLLQYMLQCGLLIPLEEGSKAGIFKKMFIDIGDDQSMENDLSTYSSHLQNMKFFIKNSDKDTLVLIVEFGTGTEPQIGGAIAEAILS
ncbi:MAG: endonuclease MutS2, partial [Bacteroidales bacterium]|nr:endonuclease MutS2 [Bacteroidales bacterium]